VTETGELFLGIIAFAVLVMAVIQVAAIFAGVRLAKRVDQLATQLDQEIKPLIANLTAMSSEAARAAALAAKQAERIDKVFGELVERVDKTLAAAEEFVTGPARQGMAIMAGVKAVVDTFRGLREASRRRTTAARSAVDEEESLFIG
jgi:outer membrane murein-binding lipoprotein Lpp